MAIAEKPAETPGWHDLARALLGLPSSGHQGFEGLVAGWLSHLLAERFYVATTGRQPLGDAANQSLEVGIQTKLVKTPPRAVEILGDLETLSRNPNLQVYVLASTEDLSLDKHQEIRSRL